MALWPESPYFQSGEVSLHWEQSCAASDLLHFRKRLGKEGIQALLALSTAAWPEAKAKEVLIDTTVEERKKHHLSN
ncbi:MAG: hypothetical protein AAF392_00865 [Bacteroidota bacterium]